MAFKASLLLAFFLLVSGCLARQQHQQQHQQQQRNQCQLSRIEALEPFETIRAEAGETEFWNSNSQEFQCAGVEFIRHRIQPGGLLLPSYTNTPLLSYVEQGRGIQGVILPGCPETYEVSSEQQFSGDRRGQRFQDRHQKVQNLNQGDVAAIPAGAAHWVHNDGDTDLVAVVFFDTQNNANQLDQNHLRFFLAGNPQDQSQQQEQGRRQSPKKGDRQQQRHSQHNARNIFQGFEVEFLAEAFNVDQETAQKLQGPQDTRGHIVNVGQNLRIIRPPQTRQEQQQQQQQGGRRPSRGGQGGGNGFEETVCSLKLRENIDNPSKADFVNPQAGRITNLNSFKFPILEFLELSAERGELLQNAIQSPHWILNAHNLIYVTSGSMWVQIVNSQGESVFDDQLTEGQVVVVPQNFAVVKKAGKQGSRWISFRTNDNAMVSNLAGRVSAIRGLPLDVVANAYQISRDDAEKLKFSQEQAVLFSPSFSKGERRAVA